MFLREFYNLKEKSECSMTEQGQDCPTHGSNECPGYQLAEGLRDGEYYLYQVTFDDGTTSDIKVGSDEFDFKTYYAKKGKNVVNVKRQGGIRSDFDEAGPFGYGAKKSRKGSVADLAAKKRQEQEKGKQPVEPRDHMVGVAKIIKDVAETSDYARRRAREEEIISGQRPARKRSPAQTSDYARRREQEKKQGVAEGISVVDQDYDLDQMILTLNIEGRKVSFTYWDYDENFANAERKDVFDQLQKQSWYARLDHPTQMEILDAAYRAIRGLEPQKYRPTVGDEPLDEQGVAEGSDISGLLAASELNRSFIVTAETAEGQKKRFRVKAQSERVAREKFSRHHAMAKILDVKEETVSESAEDLNIGDEVVVTGDVQFKGKTGVIADFGRNRAFVVVDLYNHGKKSFHSSDVSFNEYAGSEQEEADWQERNSMSEGNGVSKDKETQFHAKLDRLVHDTFGKRKGEMEEGSAQERLNQRHQELRKKSGLPDPKYYEELKATFDMPDDERWKKVAELKKKYRIKESTVTNEDIEAYLEEMSAAGYEIISENSLQCPECGGPAIDNAVLAEKQDACYHKVKSRYKVWPSAYASGALVQCRKKGAANWGNKSKK